MSLGIGVAIHSIEKLPILEQVLKPALPGHTIDSVSFLPPICYILQAPPPSFARFCDTRISSCISILGKFRNRYFEVLESLVFYIEHYQTSDSF